MNAGTAIAVDITAIAVKTIGEKIIRSAKSAKKRTEAMKSDKKRNEARRSAETM